MIEFLETTFGRIILVVIVIVIWGVNAFNFSKIVSKNQSTANNNELSFVEVAVPSKANFEYRASKRDPFEPFERVREIRKLAPDQPRVVFPNIELLGIFGTTVMLSMNGNSAVFKEPGDFLVDGVMVKKVFADSIHLEIGDQRITLTLNE